MAFVVGVHFVVTPLYDDGSTGFPVWDVINYFMAVAVLIALILSYLAKRRMDASEDDVGLRRYMGVNALFYAAAWLSMWLFWNWFVELAGWDPSQSLWAFIAPLFVIVTCAAGMRLWRDSENTSP